MGCKGLSIAIKLTFSGESQLQNPLAWFFAIAVAVCIAIQMNYLNKSLDIFNTSLVTPIYYVMFTTLTITASGILFKEWEQLTTTDVLGALCGFATIVCGVFLLHVFKDITFTLTDLINLTGRQNGHSMEESRRTSFNRQGSSSVFNRQGSSTAVQVEGLQMHNINTRRTSNKTPVLTNGNPESSGSEEEVFTTQPSVPLIQSNHDTM